jgi:hypothetical protein
MRNRTRRTLVIALALSVVATAAAYAAGPLKGKTYVGGVPSEGVANYHHHHMRLSSGGNVVLRVARNGGSVTVSLSSSTPLFYCRTSELVRVQTTKPATISRSGSFKATIDQRFVAGPGEPAIVQTVTGHFSGHSVSGNIYTNAGECGGSTGYSARAR